MYIIARSYVFQKTPKYNHMTVWHYYAGEKNGREVWRKCEEKAVLFDNKEDAMREARRIKDAHREFERIQCQRTEMEYYVERAKTYASVPANDNDYDLLDLFDSKDG